MADNRPMTWFVYLIECTDGSIYTGIAVDVAARYAAHASGKGSRYMRAHPPARLIAVFEYPDRSAASSAEHRIKQLSARQKRALANGAVETPPRGQHVDRLARKRARPVPS